MSMPNTVHFVGHAHLDVVYRWRWSEIVEYAAAESFGGILEQMAGRPAATFAQSEMILYEILEARAPELWRTIVGLIRERRWFPVGGMWVEPDMNLPCGESIVRQSLTGKRYLRRRLDADTRVAWQPDCFGHSANTPQLLRRAGFEFYVLGRFPGDDRHSAFWWEGVDGSRILCYRFPDWYNHAVDAEKTPAVLSESRARLPEADEALVLYGVGDHGGGFRESDFTAIDRLRDAGDGVRYLDGDPERFADWLASKGESLPVVKGELNPVFAGCYTTQARTKSMNRAMENAVLTAERFAAFSYHLQRKPGLMRYELADAWKKTLFLQFHDNLPGTAVGGVYADNERDYAAFGRSVAEVADAAYADIARRLPSANRPGKPVAVFNPLSFDRDEWVGVDIVPSATAGHGQAVMVDAATGGAAPAFRVPGGAGGERYVFRAAGVPSLGVKLYHFERRGAHAGAARLDAPMPRAGTDHLDNGWIRAEYDSRTGRIVDLRRRTPFGWSPNILGAPAGMALHAEGDLSDAWVIERTDELAPPRPMGPALVHNDEWTARIEQSFAFGDSVVRQVLRLDAGARMLRVSYDLDWHETDRCLSLVAPVAGTATDWRGEIPYAALTRPQDGVELPIQTWMSVDGETGGLALANDGRYGASVAEGRMRLTLVRGARDMDPRADAGRHRFTVALIPHDGEGRGGLVTVRREAHALNAPLAALACERSDGRMRFWGNPQEPALPPAFSFLRVAPETVWVGAVKPMEERFCDDHLLVRVVEGSGKPETETTLRFGAPVAEAVECDFLETPLDAPMVPEHGGVRVEDGMVKLTLGPWEIRTVRVSLTRRFGARDVGGPVAGFGD